MELCFTLMNWRIRTRKLSTISNKKKFQALREEATTNSDQYVQDERPRPPKWNTSNIFKPNVQAVESISDPRNNSAPNLWNNRPRPPIKLICTQNPLGIPQSKDNTVLLLKKTRPNRAEFINQLFYHQPSSSHAAVKT